MLRVFCSSGFSLASLFIFIFSLGHAQSSKPDSLEKIFVVKSTAKPNKMPKSSSVAGCIDCKPSDGLDKNPEFPGGEKALKEFIAKNIKRPVPSDTSMKGKVVVMFRVNEDGRVDDITVPKSLNPFCDLEAVRVVTRLPNFKPGMQNGKPVRVYCNIQIVFN